MVDMKSIDIYKDAVMRRVEEKQRERRKARKRLLAACVPLCLCIGIAAVTALPHMLPVSSDHAPENSDNTTCETLEATISHGSSAWTLSDANELYLTLQALYEPVADTAVPPDSDPESILNDSSDAESIPDVTMGSVTDSTSPIYGNSVEESPEDGTVSGYCIRLSNDTSFLLQGACLTDLASGETQLLTLEQLSMVMKLLEP